jgi:hypothetical protein
MIATSFSTTHQAGTTGPVLPLANLGQTKADCVELESEQQGSSSTLSLICCQEALVPGSVFLMASLVHQVVPPLAPGISAPFDPTVPPPGPPFPTGGADKMVVSGHHESVLYVFQ